MIYVKAEIEADDEGILAQMDRVKNAAFELRREMDELCDLLMGAKVREKRVPEEPPTEL